MLISEALPIMQAYYATDIPILLSGAPGVGKSDLVRQLATSMSVPLIDIRAALRDPVDFRGLPVPDIQSSTTRWLPPAELPQVDRDGQAGILFLDELSAAPASVQVACLGLVLDRRLGEYTLPNGWRVVAAGNRQSDGAGAQRLTSALANRLGHITIEPDHASWSSWAITQGLPSSLVAFIRWRPALLHAMPKNSTELAYPTPRSWAALARLVTPDTPPDLRHTLATSMVGEGPAAELEGFLRTVKSLPSHDAILADPTRTHVPDEPSALFALSTSLAAITTSTNFPSLMTYMQRAPQEFQALYVTDATKRLPALMSTKRFVTWATQHQGVLI